MKVAYDLHDEMNPAGLLGASGRPPTPAPSTPTDAVEDIAPVAAPAAAVTAPTAAVTAPAGPRTAEAVVLSAASALGTRAEAVTVVAGPAAEPPAPAPALGEGAGAVTAVGAGAVTAPGDRADDGVPRVDPAREGSEPTGLAAFGFTPVERIVVGQRAGGRPRPTPPAPPHATLEMPRPRLTASTLVMPRIVDEPTPDGTGCAGAGEHDGGDTTEGSGARSRRGVVVLVAVAVILLLAVGVLAVVG